MHQPKRKSFLYRLKRLFTELRARLGGYFWLPCQICGECYGGHEKGKGSILIRPGRSSMTCPNCPGHWIVEEHSNPVARRFVQVVPVLDEEGEIHCSLITGSSDWKIAPKTPTIASAKTLIASGN